MPPLRFQDVEATKKNSNDPELQAQIGDAIALATRLSQQVEAAALISVNEEAEDIPTKNLKCVSADVISVLASHFFGRYFLLTFYLAMLELKITDADRRTHCLAAKVFISPFS